MAIKTNIRSFVSGWLGLTLGGLTLIGPVTPLGIESLPAQAQGTVTPQPINTPSTPASLALAEHLQRLGAKMYGASWCPHCQSQKERFGAEAVTRFFYSPTQAVYVECSPNGRNTPQAPVCQQAEIRAYPTWVINGEKYEGSLSLEKLAELSGYSGSLQF